MMRLFARKGGFVPDQTRLKIKVGEHEFEASGDPEDVKEQYRMFVELVGTMARTPPSQPQTLSSNDTPEVDSSTPAPSTPANDLVLTKIMKQEGRLVSLTVRPKSLIDAIMLLMLGHKVIRSSEYTTGAELIDGLKTTGGITFSRIDKIMEKISDDGDIIVTGERRGKKYRMTNAGMTKARQIAQDLLAQVA
jgi:hypothetical protein